MTAMDTPAALPVHGRVSVEWPNAERCAPGPLECWRTNVRDAETGLPLPSMVSVKVTADNGKHVFADVTHWTDDDGEILPSPAWPDPDNCPVKVFRYEVMSMSVGRGPEFWTEFGDGTVRRDATGPVTGMALDRG